MPDKLWKAVERKIADYLGGRRVPVTGRQRGDAPDIEHDVLSLEVKHREALPKWMHEAMLQAEASAKNGQLPMVVIHEKQQAVGRCFAVVRLEDWKDRYG